MLEKPTKRRHKPVIKVLTDGAENSLAHILLDFKRGAINISEAIDDIEKVIRRRIK